MNEKYKKLSCKIAIFKSFFFFIRDEKTALGKIVLRVLHRKREEKAEAAPAAFPHTASAQSVRGATGCSPLLCLHPTISQLLQHWDLQLAELLWTTAQFMSIIWYGTWWIIKRTVMGKCVHGVCFSSFYLSRLKAPLWECPHCIPNLFWNKAPALWGAVLHPCCFFLPPLNSISLTVTVRRKALLRFN